MTDEPAERLHDGPHHRDGPEECFGCRVKSVCVGLPKDFRSRSNVYSLSSAPPKTPNNSWEKGIATDERGMPFLSGPDLHPMGVKEAGEKRHLIEEHRRRMRQDPHPLTTS